MSASLAILHFSFLLASVFLFQMLFKENDVQFPLKRYHVFEFSQTPLVMLHQVEVHRVVVGQVVVSLP